MLEYKIQPIGIWPGQPTSPWSRKRSAFKIVETKVLDHIERELRHLGGKEVIFRLEVQPHHLRNDGMLRANARPTAPGVILEFTATRLKGSPRLLYRCDTFTNYWHNLSAIARGLEALRMVDRYGVTPTGEQYAGFKALPAATGPTMDVSTAAERVAAYTSDLSSRDVISSLDSARRAIRVALAKTHPDATGGERGAYDVVEAARRILTAHHGVSL
jgi:hypothetical protein